MRTSLSLLLVLAGCVDPTAPTEPTAPNQLRGDDKADGGPPLWAGLTSITLERWVADPCNDGRTALGDQLVHYDSWVRQRAGVRNICFEVWSPSVTDWDNPDFWKQLDVQVHRRFGATGDYQHAYVSSNGRRYNNRRYQWSLDGSLDPFAWAQTVPAVAVPLTITEEGDDWVSATADMEVYFTVNGRVLNAPADRPFVVRYEHTLRKPTLAPSEDGYVLHDIVTCDGARFGSGAGFFVADIRSPAAIATLGAGADGSLLYGVPLARQDDLLSFTYTTQHPVAGQALPGFSDPNGLRIVPDGSTMRVELDVYDRTTGKTTLTSTFAGCTSAN